MKKIKTLLRSYLSIDDDAQYVIKCLQSYETRLTKCNEHTTELFKMHSEFEGDIASNYNSIEELESKVGYYNDYDLERMSQTIHENYNGVESNKYLVDECWEKITAFTSNDGETNSAINDVYVVDNIELLKPKITEIINEVITQYCVSVSAQLRKVE